MSCFIIMLTDFKIIPITIFVHVYQEFVYNTQPLLTRKGFYPPDDQGNRQSL